MNDLLIAHQSMVRSHKEGQMWMLKGILKGVELDYLREIIIEERAKLNLQFYEGMPYDAYEMLNEDFVELREQYDNLLALLEQRQRELALEAEHQKKEKKKAKLPPVLPKGTLPEELDTPVGKMLLQKAINAKLIDSKYQPYPETKTVELRVLSLAISIEMGLNEYHALFYQLWGKESVKHTKWRAGEANYATVERVAKLFTEATQKQIKELYEAPL